MKTAIVYVFVDALGWEIVSKHNFMASTFPHRNKVGMQFGYSSTAIPTILSGTSPAEHGHFSFFYYDPKNSPFKMFRFMKYFFGAGLHPKCIMNRGRVRHWVSKIVKKLMGFTGYFQLYGVPYERLPYFDYCEKTDIFAKNGLAPVKNLRDILEESGLKFHISDWRKTERENIDAAKDAIKDGADFVFVYTADFDGFMHDNVGNENAISPKLKTYEEKLNEIFNTLKKTNRPFKMSVISDHGMTPRIGTVDLKKKVDELGLKFGKDYISIFDSTMLRLWYLDDAARPKIRERLLKPDCRGIFVSAEQKRICGIDFPNNKFGEDIFLMDAGVQIEPSDMGQKSLRGMHGFSPDDKDSFAAFMSTDAPKFEPREVKDFFALMKADINELKESR